MMGTLSRGPTTLARCLRLPSTTLTGVRSLSTTLASSPRRKFLLQPGHLSRCLHQSRLLRANAATAQATRYSEDGSSDGTDTITQFDELASKGLVSPVVIDTITKDFKFETMTDVQSATINEALQGIDMIAQAKTGTGKTLGFLLPVLQNIIKESPELENRPQGRGRAVVDIRTIIVSPTRELAEQIATEARKLTRHTGVMVQTAVGGSHKKMMLDQLHRQGCHILVATPGRLNDLLSDSYSGVEAPNLSTIVFDEADRLLDAGFSTEIENIMRYLPDPSERDRQTLMFSATVSDEVVRLVRKTLKPDFRFVKTVRDDEVPTHERIPQKIINVRGLENYLPTLLELLRREAAALEGKALLKVLVYFNTTVEVQFASSVFNELGTKCPIPLRYVDEIHGRRTQAERSRATENFRRNKTGMLLSSDVTARGMDFPDVTHVIQMGLPPNTEQYIHRIGRTGRAGKEGQGYLINCDLARQEARRRLRGLPIEADESLSTGNLDMAQPAQLPSSAVQILNDLSRAMQNVSRGEKAKVYMAQLGSFQQISDKQALIDAMNRLAKWGWGMEMPPSISRSLAQRLGLDRCQGVIIGDEAPRGMSGRSSSPVGDDDRFGRDDFRGSGSQRNRGFQRDDAFSRDRGGGFQRNDPFSRDRAGGYQRNDAFGRNRGGGFQRNDSYGRYRGGSSQTDDPFGRSSRSGGGFGERNDRGGRSDSMRSPF